MGKLILCSSAVAKTPYKMPVSGTRIYTIEELCYYIYHNIYEIDTGCFNKKMAQWIRSELGMKVIADKLDTMIDNESSLKDIVISILCSCDYYDEDEIKALLGVIKEIEDLPFCGREKQKADMYLRHGRYMYAKKEYDRIITGGYAVNLSPKEYGNILNNRAIACYMLGLYSDALLDLKDAYSRNNDSRTLRQYLYTLLLCGQKNEYQKEIINYNIDNSVAEGIMTLYNNARARARSSIEYEEVIKLRKYTTDSEMGDYAAGKISVWKRQYREAST